MSMPALFKGRLSLPVIGAPLFIISVPDLVIAQCKAGVVGSFPALNARAKGAGESLSNLAKPPTMVSGRAACLVAANGAPDCKAGADRLCQSKGHKEGKSLDTDAAEKCSPKVYLPGHKREPGDCRIENYVTRALCQ